MGEWLVPPEKRQSSRLEPIQEDGPLDIDSEEPSTAPIAKICLPNARVFAPGDLIKGKVMFHSMRRSEIVKVAIALKGCTSTKTQLSLTSRYHESPDEFTLVSETLYTAAAGTKIHSSPHDAHTKSWDFALSIPRYIHGYSSISGGRREWCHNERFADPKSSFEVPPSLSVQLHPEGAHQGQIIIGADYQLQAIVRYRSGLEKHVSCIQPKYHLEMLSFGPTGGLVRTAMPLTRAEGLFRGRVNSIIGSSPPREGGAPPQIIIKRVNAAIPQIYLYTGSDVEAALLKVTVKFSEEIHARWQYNQRGLLKLGEEETRASQSVVRSSSDLNAAILEESKEQGLDLDAIMGECFADAISTFLPTMTSANINIYHRLKLTLKVRVNGQRYEVELEQSFKVPKRVNSDSGSADAFTTMPTQDGSRQDSAIDGIMCGDALVHPLATAKGRTIDMLDGDAIMRRDWAVW